MAPKPSIHSEEACFLKAVAFSHLPEERSTRSGWVQPSEARLTRGHKSNLVCKHRKRLPFNLHSGNVLARYNRTSFSHPTFRSGQRSLEPLRLLPAATHYVTTLVVVAIVATSNPKSSTSFPTPMDARLRAKADNC